MYFCNSYSVTVQCRGTRGSPLASTTWSNSLIIGMCLVANAQIYVIMYPLYKQLIYTSARCKKSCGESFLPIIGSLLCRESDTIRLWPVGVWRMFHGRSGVASKYGVWNSLQASITWRKSLIIGSNSVSNTRRHFLVPHPYKTILEVYWFFVEYSYDQSTRYIFPSIIWICKVSYKKNRENHYHWLFFSSKYFIFRFPCTIWWSEIRAEQTRYRKGHNYILDNFKQLWEQH